MSQIAQITGPEARTLAIKPFDASVLKEIEKALMKSDIGIAPENVFAFGDYVGGRFSVHSPVGVLPLALQYGMAPLREFLAGAHAMDLHFKNTPLGRNLPVLLGLLGLYNSTFLGYNC